MTIFRDVLEEMAKSRSASSWDARLTAWEKPASNLEETELEYAADRVRIALRRDPWFATEGVQIRGQGSYHNDTNVRLEADMDLCAWHPGLLTTLAQGLSTIDVDKALDLHRSGPFISDVAAQLRKKIVAALSAEFGTRNIDTSGTKAVTVTNIEGSRAPTDVAPAIRTLYVRHANFLEVGPYASFEGVTIFGTNGGQTINFPALHHANGKVKRALTKHRFKKVVRMLKKLRDELVYLGKLKNGVMSSFLIECLVYNVEDEHFLHEESRLDRLKRILLRIDRQMGEPLFPLVACEINGVKPLFDSAPPWNQRWTPNDVITFLIAAWARLTA